MVELKVRKPPARIWCVLIRFHMMPSNPLCLARISCDLCCPNMHCEGVYQLVRTVIYQPFNKRSMCSQNSAVKLALACILSNPTWVLIPVATIWPSTCAARFTLMYKLAFMLETIPLETSFRHGQHILQLADDFSTFVPDCVNVMSVITLSSILAMIIITSTDPSPTASQIFLVFFFLCESHSLWKSSRLCQDHVDISGGLLYSGTLNLFPLIFEGALNEWIQTCI